MLLLMLVIKLPGPPSGKVLKQFLLMQYSVKIPPWKGFEKKRIQRNSMEFRCLVPLCGFKLIKCDFWYSNVQNRATSQFCVLYMYDQCGSFGVHPLTLALFMWKCIFGAIK